MADTEQGQRIIDSWRSQETGKPVNVPVGADTTPARNDLNQFFKELTGQAPQRVPVSVAPSVENMLLPPGSGAAPPRARGGIYDVLRSVESFATGKLPRQALIQRPVAGAGLVQWAEPSTDGEAFIPLNTANRKRSTAIWLETGKQLGALRFERGGIRDGGARGLDQAVSNMVGTPYVRGGHTPSGADCSGAMSYLVHQALGLPNDSRMATGNAADWPIGSRSAGSGRAMVARGRCVSVGSTAAPAGAIWRARCPMGPTSSRADRSATSPRGARPRGRATSPT